MAREFSSSPGDPQVALRALHAPGPWAALGRCICDFDAQCPHHPGNGTFAVCFSPFLPLPSPSCPSSPFLPQRRLYWNLFRKTCVGRGKCVRERGLLRNASWEAGGPGQRACLGFSSVLTEARCFVQCLYGNERSSTQHHFINECPRGFCSMATWAVPKASSLLCAQGVRAVGLEFDPWSAACKLGPSSLSYLWPVEATFVVRTLKCLFPTLYVPRANMTDLKVPS